ncbi:cysteine-rich rlk (receptor-like protein kinase) 8 [Ceraceosorus bombacis]|uniref:Cysteine-rich rlk (Receptor-like protein kinase) 8 n=1 Tax=Ceraceosorus bombacis TaxID=401625 RepID=A0A0P1BF14_9BASI|nr:cysteine-rich rlk (receptor-like protein kinase) 8 [Ceraceosorus bombacis]
MSGAAITWRSQKQPTVARSSVEAEYYAIADAVSEMLWLKQFFNELGFDFASIANISLFSDSSGALAVAQDAATSHNRLKHIDIRHHFIKKHLQDLKGILSVVKVPTADNVADLLTKALAKDQHRYLASRMGVVDLAAASRVST